MPRLDDPTIKLKKVQPFKRESLRPWDDLENFKPKGPENNNHNADTNDHAALTLESNHFAILKKSIGKPLVNSDKFISKPLVNHNNPISKPLVNNDGSIGKPLVNHEEPIGKPQKPNKETISKLIGKPTDTTISKPLVNQLVNQTSTSSEVFSTAKQLTGNLLKMLIYIVEDCKARGLLYTTPITNETFRNLLNTDVNSVKTTAQRLINKGFMTRHKGKKGNGGYTIYAITEEVRNATIEMQKQLAISKPLVNQLVNINSKPLVNHKETDRLTEPSSSSSIYKTTTTSANTEWGFDLSSYKHFGFTEAHIKQLVAMGNLSATAVEQSLVEFSYDLNNNATPPIKTSKINFLMGLLRSGHSYVSEGFRNEQEAVISEMARRAEEKRKKLLEEKFLAWEASLSDEEKRSINEALPPQLMVLSRAGGIGNQEVRNWFFDYFLQKSSK